MATHWCNGQWLDAADYPGASQDRGAVFGLGLFETMGASDGAVVFPERHLVRLGKSCERLGWTPALPDLRNVAEELLSRNSLAEGLARLRLVITAGTGSHNDLKHGEDHLVWLSAFRISAPPESITLCTSPWPRNERSPLAGLKTACYAENILALDDARRRGFEESLFLNTAGEVCETATANVFCVKGEVLLTPSLDSGCLPGIGREVLLEIARQHDIPVEERGITPDELASADEIFISSSTRGPVSVVRFENRSSEKGSICSRLKLYWQEAVARNIANR